MKRIVIFANPKAGRGRAARLVDVLQSRITREGLEPVVVSQHPLSATDEQVRDAAAVVSIGGDGTLRAAVERVTDGGRHAGPGVLVVPMGTANLMGRHLGVALSPRRAEEHVIEILRAGRRVHLDVGILRASEQNGEPAPARLFLLMAGVGIDGAIVHALDRIRTGPIGFSSYLKPAFTTLAGYDYPRLEVEVDGRLVSPMRPSVVWAGNIKEYGTGFELLPHATSDDGLLDVCVLPARSAGELIHHFMTAAAGEHLHGEGVVYVKGTRVKVTADRPVSIQADGDPGGWTPAEMEISSVRVAFIAP